MSENKTGYGYELQAKENDRQRGYGKIWDTVSNDFGKGIIFKEKLNIDGFLYALAIKGGFKKLQVVLDSSKSTVIQAVDTLEVSATIGLTGFNEPQRSKNPEQRFVGSSFCLLI